MTLTDFLLARIAETERWGQCFPKDSPGGRYILAECEAKRRIVERHRPFSHGRCQACYSIEGQDEWTANPWPCLDLRDLASVYADHPDYREEWKP